jgi:UDP-N-acetylmuramate--alanine ligase
MKLSKIKHIHFIGAGGVGMIGIAEMLLNQGYKISGSDILESKNTRRLKEKGAKVFIGHNTNNIKGADVIVYSSAVSDRNPEIVQAKKDNKIIIPRAEMLSSLMKKYQSIAVAGSHGKTTTTSMIANIFSDAELDPTYIVGGRIMGKENSSILGKSDYLIVEADESDGTFMHLNPEMSVLTNIDNDHLDFYDNNQTKLEQTFYEFLEKIPFSGTAVICTDEIKAKKVFKKLSRQKISYGFKKGAIYQIGNLIQTSNNQTFEILDTILKKSYKLTLKIPGKHNALNAAAAFIVSKISGISTKLIINSLKKFSGVKRRLELKGNIKLNNKEVMLFDDYGHHPTEIEATIDALKNTYSDKKIFMVFQPHRYSRSMALFDEFIKILSKVDALIMLDIYSAGEQNHKNISSYDFLNRLLAINSRCFFAKNIQDIKRNLEDHSAEDHLIITQGAGNIAEISNSLFQTLK